MILRFFMIVTLTLLLLVNVGKAQYQKVYSNGIHIYYRIFGEGIPILILGGGPGDNSNRYLSLCKLLSVAMGLNEFYQNYDPDKDRVWICEHNEKIIGFLLLMHRDGNAAQLRYFLIKSAYRGIGLGKRLMSLYMDFFHKCGYKSSYLWTTHELYTAASLYRRYGFELTEEKGSTAFGKPLKEQRYDLINT